jgi:NitT/TauT family transport system ATP-binding protein/sulfonate transport system ATP-binding protein
MSTKASILSVEHVGRVYDDEEDKRTVALEDVSFGVAEGEFVSLIGHSGCGKTTLLRLIAGLDDPQEGRLLLDGEPIAGSSPERGFVFQQGGLFPWLTVSQNIAFGLKARGTYDTRSADVDEYLRLIGLDGFGDSYPHQISGGMAQRVAIARSLINNPRVLLLDEPMGALDSFTRADLQDKLLALRERNHTTMILVTHDVDEAVYLSDRIVLMAPRPGRVSEEIRVDIARPRDRTSDGFLALRTRILDKLHLAGVGAEASDAAPADDAGLVATR